LILSLLFVILKMKIKRDRLRRRGRRKLRIGSKGKKKRKKKRKLEGNLPLKNLMLNHLLKVKMPRAKEEKSYLKVAY
jgi:hypothetical protein